MTSSQYKLNFPMEWSFHMLLVLVASCFVNANPFALALAFGTLYVPLLEKFNEDRAKTATVQALLIGLTGSTGVIWGFLSRKYGLSRVMILGSVLVPSGYIASFFAKSLYPVIICIGICSGIGTSIVYVCSSAAVAQTFTGKRARIAMALHNCAVGAGIVVYPFLLDFNLRKYGISGTFLLLGGLNLNNIVVAQVYYNSIHIKQESDNSPTTEQSETSTNSCTEIIQQIKTLLMHIKSVLVRILKFRLIVVILATGISDGCFHGFLVVVLDIFASKGFSAQEGLYSLTVFNASSIIGRLLPVLFLLKDNVHPMAVFIICSTFGCAGQILVLKASNVSMMYVGSGLSGMAMGGIISGGSVALVHFAHRELFGAAFGLMITIIGVITSVMGPLYGWMRDELKSYDAVLLLSTSFLGIVFLISLVAACVTKTDPEEIVKPMQVEVEI